MGWLISRANSGDIESARAIAEAVAIEIRNGKPINEPLRSYIADALVEIAGGGDAGRALSVKNSRGRSRFANEERDQGIAEGVRARIDLDQCTREQAIALVATDYSLSDDAVAKIYNKYRYLFDP